MVLETILQNRATRQHPFAVNITETNLQRGAFSWDRWLNNVSQRESQEIIGEGIDAVFALAEQHDSSFQFAFCHPDDTYSLVTPACHLLVEKRHGWTGYRAFAEAAAETRSWLHIRMMARIRELFA